MKTREIAELIFLTNVLNAAKYTERTQDGPKILAARDGNNYDLEKIGQRANELFAKFMKPYKIKN